jgi:hypothetical protein
MKATFAFSLAVILVVSASAQAPDVVSYQGYLHEGDAPMNNPAATLTFRIYEVPEGGDPLWTETRGDINVQDGIFSVLLGDTQPFGDVPFGVPLWLGIAVADGDELTPRTMLAAVPYSLQSRSLKLPFAAAAETPPEDAALSIQNSGSGRAIEVSGGGQGIYVSEVAGDGVAVGIAGTLVYTGTIPTSNGFQVTSAQHNGLFVGGTGESGVHVEQADKHGILIKSAGAAGVRVESASNNGIFVASAGQNGVFVGEAGSPDAKTGSATRDGFEVQGAEGHGLYIGYSGQDGVYVDSTADWANGLTVRDAQNGLYVVHARYSGVDIDEAGTSGIQIGRTRSHGIEIGDPEMYGMLVHRPKGGGIAMVSVGTPASEICDPGRNAFTVCGAEDHGLYVGYAGSDGVHVRSAAGWAGYFNGDVRVTGTIDNTSDRRLKAKIRPTSYGLREVLALVPVDFEWEERPDEGTRLGLIAQDVEDVIPEVVTQPNEKDEYYGLAYTELIPVLIKAIQEQQAELEVLRGRIAAVEGAVPP